MMINSTLQIRIQYLWKAYLARGKLSKCLVWDQWNPSRHQGMILGKTDHQFNFSVNDSEELFGITIDKDLMFKQHVSSMCKKVNNQFSVMTRFGKLMSTETMLHLYKAFILTHFYYCSMVWHFSSKQDSDKLDLLNKRILRFIFKDFNSDFN